MRAGDGAGSRVDRDVQANSNRAECRLGILPVKKRLEGGGRVSFVTGAQRPGSGAAAPHATHNSASFPRRSRYLEPVLGR
jgi:hypothetical protein